MAGLRTAAAAVALGMIAQISVAVAQQCTAVQAGGDFKSSCAACIGSKFGPQNKTNTTTAQCMFCSNATNPGAGYCTGSAGAVPDNCYNTAAACASGPAAAPSNSTESECTMGEPKGCWEIYTFYIIAAGAGILLLLGMWCWCRRCHAKGVKSWLMKEDSKSRVKHLQLQEDSNARHEARGARKTDVRAKYGLK